MQKKLIEKLEDISGRCLNCNVPEIAHGSECGWQNTKLLVMPGGKHVVNFNGKDDNKENWEWLIKTVCELSK